MQVVESGCEGGILRHSTDVQKAKQSHGAEPATLSAGTRTYLNFRDVCAKFGVTERTAHRIVAEPWFPAPVALGPRVRRWISEEIDVALASRAPRGRSIGDEPPELQQSRQRRAQGAASEAAN